MSFDPNRNSELDLRTRPNGRGNWGAWIAVAAVVLIAAFAWMQWGGTAGVDSSTTASTKPPITQPAPEPMAPATPPAATPQTPSTDTGTKP